MAEFDAEQQAADEAEKSAQEETTTPVAGSDAIVPSSKPAGKTASI
jgi:hypothetical protein